MISIGSYKIKKGVDISEWQGDINMKKVQDAGYDFVMIRCGWGTDTRSHDDGRFSENVRKAEEIGMPWGTYLFSYACSTSEAQSEVAHVDRLLKAERKRGYRPTFPVAIDIEWTQEIEDRGGWNSKNLTNTASIFLDGVKKLGYYPMIYTGGSELSMMNDHIRKDFDCWFAQWYTSPTDYKYDRLGIWQYGGETNYIDGNSISGVGVIDKDKSYKDYPSIIKNGGWNGWQGAADHEPSEDVIKHETCNLTFVYLAKQGYVSEGAQVKTAQRLLKAMDYLGADAKPLTVDGIFGTNTDYAVRTFQKKAGITSDGIIGKDTWKKLTGAA